jgi:hypothetical protein
MPATAPGVSTLCEPILPHGRGAVRSAYRMLSTPFSRRAATIGALNAQGTGVAVGVRGGEAASTMS